MFKKLLRGLFNIVSGKSGGVYINRAGRLVGENKALPKGAFVNAIEIASGEFIKIVPVGKFPTHPDGPHEITTKEIQEMADNFANSGKDLLFDYEHDSLWGRTIAAGWSNEVQVREDGLYVKYPDFTRNAQQQITDREYRYFSPVYYLNGTDKDGSNLGAVLDSVAITNRPWMDREIEHIRNDDNPQMEVDTMKYSADYKKEIGLPEDATDEQVEVKVQKLNELAAEGVKLQQGKDTDPEEPETDDTEETEIADADKPVTKGELVDAVANAFKPFLDKDRRKEAEALVNSAIADVKILPADKEVWLNSAIANFDETKTKLDARKKNSAMPGGVNTSTSSVAENQKSNSKPSLGDLKSAATEAFKNQGRAPVGVKAA